MTTRITHNSVGMAVAVGLFIGLCCNECLASEKCKNNSGSTKHVCVAWDRELAPVEGTDFEVNYACQGCSDDPAVELKTGDDKWVVWSEVISTGAPANIGSLTTTDAENYVVTIANGSNAGAANVGSMVLAPDGAAYSPPTSACGCDSSPSISAKISRSSKNRCCAAPDGHTATHVPQPLQSASSTTEIFFSSSKLAASYGQTLMHSLHPPQVVSSTTLVMGSMTTEPRSISDRILAAAASYEALYGSNGDPFREISLRSVSD